MLSLLELFYGLLAGSEGVADAVESYGQRRDDAKADAAWAATRKAQEAHVWADILVLAALHDGLITRAERKELASSLPALLAKAGVQTTSEQLIERWNAREEAVESDQELSDTVASLASWLNAPQKSRLFEAIVQLNRSDPAEDSAPTSPYRARVRQSVTSTIRLFGDALRIDETTIERAETR